eukprot:3304687-Prymnesium_polylepis.1
MVAAALAGKGGGRGKDDSNRQKKIAEHSSRGRLPDGQRCKSETCNFDHDAKHPGKPCYSVHVWKSSCRTRPPLHAGIVAKNLAPILLGC